MNIDQQLAVKQSRRMHAQTRFLDRINARESQAEQMIGELSNGTCYIFPVGGKYREGSRAELVAFLIRNNYA